jgi:hypothetical protein
VTWAPGERVWGANMRGCEHEYEYGLRLLACNGFA